MTHLKMARLSDHSTNGRRRFSFGLSLMKCCPPNTSAAYRPQNMKALLLWRTTHTIIINSLALLNGNRIDFISWEISLASLIQKGWTK